MCIFRPFCSLYGPPLSGGAGAIRLGGHRMQISQLLGKKTKNAIMLGSSCFSSNLQRASRFQQVMINNNTNVRSDHYQQQRK